MVDDTNGSPVFSVEEGVPYLYIATSLHWTASPRLKLGDVPIFKINAITGEYVWKHTYLCNTVAGISRRRAGNVRERKAQHLRPCHFSGRAYSAGSRGDSCRA